jgi:predicted acylesterase/phospholipase RssA
MNDYNFDTLVLSGENTRCIITLGALNYIYDKNLYSSFVNYVGVSSGSLICYLLILGYSPQEIFLYVCKHDIYKDFNISNNYILDIINGNGIFKVEILTEHLEKLTLDKLNFIPTLGQLKEIYNKNLHCITCNFTKSQLEIFSSDKTPNVNCIDALRMSCNLPFIFGKFKYNDNEYVDGVFRNNFPIDIGEEIGNKILGIYLSSKEENSENFISYFYKLISTPVDQIISENIKKCNKSFIIKIECEAGFCNFDLHIIEKLDMFSVGYQTIKKILN